MKYIILARPSSLIITDVKRLIAQLGLKAKTIGKLRELASFDAKDIGAIVVSTAISSPVKHNYCEVIARAKKLYPGIPLFLSSFTSVYSTMVIAKAHFERAGIDLEPISLEEAKAKGFDSNRPILILAQQDLANPSLLIPMSTQVYEVIHDNYHNKGMINY